MDIQQVFYVIAIAFMISIILVSVVLAVFIWKLNKTLEKIRTYVIELAANQINTGKTRLTTLLVGGMSTFLISKLRNLFKR